MTDAALQQLFRTAIAAADRHRLEDAVIAFRAVLLAQPDYAPALHGLGVALRRLGRVAESEAVLRTGIERHPQSVDLLIAQAETLEDWGRLDDAVDLAEKAHSLGPDDGRPMAVLARLRERQGHGGLARAALETAAASRRPTAAALTALGRMQRQAGEIALARETLDRAVRAAGKEDMAAARVQRAIAMMCNGEIAEGFREYDWRWKTGLLPSLNPGLPPWTGDPLAGRTLLVRAEQGMSESLQFFRLAAGIEGGRVIFEAPPALVPILRASHRVYEVVPEGGPLPQADCWAPLLSLPRLLKIDADTIPDDVPYLRPDPSLLAPWRERLGPGPKIAIAWQGGEPLFEQRKREIPLADFAPLAAVPGVRLISLQKGGGRQQIDAVPFPVYDPTDEMDEGDAAFIDTAVVMQECALVVTADTAIAHLAGALARPCWTVLPEGGDWRFGWHATQSAWYPTMECLRKPPGGTWRDVFDHIARRLIAIREGREDPAAIDEAPSAQGMGQAAPYGAGPDDLSGN